MIVNARAKPIYTYAVISATQDIYMDDNAQVAIQLRGGRQHRTTDAALLDQIRDHDEVFHDIQPSPSPGG